MADSAPMPSRGYVAMVTEHLRDGTDQSAKVVSSKSEAEAWLTQAANSFFGRNCSFCLFELGKEIPLKETTIEEPQPSKKQVKMEIA